MRIPILFYGNEVWTFNIKSQMGQTLRDHKRNDDIRELNILSINKNIKKEYHTKGKNI